MRNEKTWLRTLLVALPLIAIGITLLVLAAFEKRVWIQNLLTSFGTLFIVAVGFALVWELVQKEALLEEWGRFGRESEQIRAAGIVGATKDLYYDVPWAELFTENSELELFIAYGYSWRSINRQLLEEFLSKPKARLRVALVNPTDFEVVGQLAKRYSVSEPLVRESIEKACTFFADLGDQHPGKVWVYLARRAPLFTIYRFQTRAVLGLFNHRHQKDRSPAVIVRSGGFLYRFLEDELDFLLKRTDSPLVDMFYPPRTPSLLTPQTRAPAAISEQSVPARLSSPARAAESERAQRESGD
jgi:hypothetical protein